MSTATIATDVLAFLKQPSTMQAQAEQVVGVISEMAKDYTRGKGFSGTEPLPTVQKVIVLASARLLANPEQIEFQTGSVAIRGAFDGWNPLEKTLLNSIRKAAS